MALVDNPGLDLVGVLGTTTPVSPATRDQAADLVDDFVHEQAVASFDRLLHAAENGDRVQNEQRTSADMASRLVDAEVRRFVELDRHRE